MLLIEEENNITEIENYTLDREDFSIIFDEIVEVEEPLNMVRRC